MSKAIKDVATTIATIGRLLFELKRPIHPEAIPAIPICKKPSKADALPTLLVKGAIARADPFG